MQKTCLIIQSGALGDLFLVAPIANYYHKQGYLVTWPVREQHFNLVSKYFPFIEAVSMSQDKFPILHSDYLRSDTMNVQRLADKGNYDIVIDTADRDSKTNEQPYENFEQYKYRRANVPFSFKHHLSWKEDKEKQSDLRAIIENVHNIDIIKDNYITCHLDSSHGDHAKLPENEDRHAIEITRIEGFEIPDWYDIIANSQAFYGVESSVHLFVDGCINRLKYYNPRLEFFLLSRSSLKAGEQYTISQHWDNKYMK